MRKYGMSNLEFIVIEYCEPYVQACRKLEQSYLDLYKPIYNILTTVGSSLGLKHSEETKRLLSSLHTKALHPQYGTKWTETRRIAMNLSLKDHFAENGHHNKGKTGINAPQYGINGISVHCYSSDGQYQHFLSINQARI